MTPRFEMFPTPLDGLVVLLRRRMDDSRGYFERLFCGNELSRHTGGKPIAQVNHTLTVHSGTVRGLHYQLAPHAEIKFVQCLHGKVFDVVVDLRPESPTYLHWHHEILCGDDAKTLVIPEGCAHGFQTLETNCEMLYFHTAAHHPEAESGMHPLASGLGIAWPMRVCDLSARDAKLPEFHSR